MHKIAQRERPRISVHQRQSSKTLMQCGNKQSSGGWTRKPAGLKRRPIALKTRPVLSTRRMEKQLSKQLLRKRTTRITKPLPKCARAVMSGRRFKKSIVRAAIRGRKASIPMKSAKMLLKINNKKPRNPGGNSGATRPRLNDKAVMKSIASAYNTGGHLSRGGLYLFGLLAMSAFGQKQPLSIKPGDRLVSGVKRSLKLPCSPRKSL
jgi:hypothetical protein